MRLELFLCLWFICLLRGLAHANDMHNTQNEKNFYCGQTSGDCYCGTAETCKCSMYTGICHAEKVQQSVKCQQTSGDCYCGTAETCKCSMSTGICHAEKVQQSVECGQTNGDCNAGKAKTVQCSMVSGNCNAGKAEDVTANLQGGNVNAADVTKKVTCKVQSGVCKAGSLESDGLFDCSGTSVTCVATLNSKSPMLCSGVNANCYCGSSSKCSVKSGVEVSNINFNCQNSKDCECDSSATNSQCCLKDPKQNTNEFPSPKVTSNGCCSTSDNYCESVAIKKEKEEVHLNQDIWGPRFVLASFVLMILAYVYLEYKKGRLFAKGDKKGLEISSENNVKEGLLDDTSSLDTPKKSAKDICIDSMKRLYLCLDVVILLGNTLNSIKGQGHLAATMLLGDEKMYSGENTFTTQTWYTDPNNDHRYDFPPPDGITVWTAGVTACDRTVTSIAAVCDFETEPIYVVAYGTWLMFLFGLLFRKVYQSLHYQTDDLRFYLSSDHFAKSNEMKHATYFGYFLTLANSAVLISYANKDGRGLSNYLGIMTFAGINCYAFYSSTWTRWPIFTAEINFHELFPRKIAFKPCTPAAANLYGVIVGCEKLYHDMIKSMNQSNDALAEFGNPSELRDVIAKLYQEPSTVSVNP